MKIDVSNINKLKAALQTAQGKATARILNVEDIQELAGNAKSELTKFLPKKYHQGSRYIYYEADLANAYKYVGATTYIQLEHGYEKWFVTDISRIEIYPREPSRSRLILPKNSQQLVLKHLGLNFAEAA